MVPIITVPNRKSKLGADFFLQWFKSYDYTQFEMRRKLVCKFFFPLKLWPDKVFNRYVPAINQGPIGTIIIFRQCVSHIFYKKAIQYCQKATFLSHTSNLFFFSFFLLKFSTPNISNGYLLHTTLKGSFYRPQYVWSKYQTNLNQF